MLFIIFLSVAVFFCSSFFNSQPLETVGNPIMVYYFHQANFFREHYVFSIFIFVTLTLLFFRFNFDKKYNYLKIYFFSTLQVLFVIFLGFFLAFVLLLITALVELNVLSVLANINPKIIGVETNKKNIVAKLNDSFIPKIITSDKDRIIYAVAKTTSGTNNLYGKYIVSTIPSFLVLPTKNLDYDVLLLDDYLIISDAKSRDMQLISSLIGYVFVKNYFPTRSIKHFPKIAIMNKQEYFEYRKNETNKKLEKLDKQIAKIDSFVGSMSAALKENKKLNTPANRKVVNEYSYYESYFKKQRNIIKFQVEKVPHESGLFVPENSIKIVFGTANVHELVDYFSTVVHEYLHYASFVSDKKRFENSFFEEGLTEYFARGAIKESLDTDTNLGYPVQVKIIKQITKMITETELADLYFVKDETGLEKALDRVYGDDFYKDNAVLFETLQFSSDPKQTLKLANEIMQKINGQPLTEKDLYSSYSR